MSAAVQHDESLPELDAIFDELARAKAKFPTWSNDPLHALAVLGEETGELNKEMLQLVYEPHKSSLERVREEAIQAAAMAVRLMQSLPRYHYRACAHHLQSHQGELDPAEQLRHAGVVSANGEAPAALPDPKDDIARAVLRAQKASPTWPTDPLHALARVSNAAGGLTREMVMLSYAPVGGDDAQVRAAAVATAVTLIRLVSSLGRYEYRPGPQHVQPA